MFVVNRNFILASKPRLVDSSAEFKNLLSQALPPIGAESDTKDEANCFEII